MPFYSHKGRLGLQIAGVLLILTTVAMAEVDVERSGLLYGLGTVEQVNDGTATIDVGDAHVIRVHDNVAVFRQSSGYYTPVGVVKIAETHPTWSRTVRSTRDTVQAGDLVMFVREFRELKTGTQYLDEFLARQIIADSRLNSHSTHRRLHTAMALLSYRDQYKTWEGRRGDEIGFIEGASFANGQRERIQQLLKHVSMVRRQFQVGRNSLPAAGPGWEQTLPLLFGETVIAQHEAAQSIVAEDDPFVDNSGVDIRRVRLVVRQTLFDRLEEEKNLVAFLVATILEQAPDRTELWFQEQVRNSQFPQLAREEIMLEQLRLMLREIRGET